MSTDSELLRRYLGEKSEPAFTEFVQRFIGLVYSVALRRVGGDAQLPPMNTQRFCYGLIAACLTPWALSSFAGAEVVSAYRGNKPTPFDVAVERGMSRALARQLAGEPDARVGVDIWIYVDCRLTSDAARTSENNTLCIGFAGDRVAVLKLVPLQAVRELVATGRVVALSKRLKVVLRATARTAKSP